MNPTLLRSLPALASLLALTAIPAARAQSAAATTEKRNDDVISLSEFSVKAENDRGYIASETMTGSRIATKIVDLPYTVNMLTSEFLEDFGIFELADNIVQIGSFTGLDIGGNFNLRGFQSTYQLRDGFFRLEGGTADSSIAPVAPRIDLPVAALIGPVNSSATFGFAANARRSGRVRLFGETTGGNQRGINGGRFFFVRLPASGLEFDLPLIGYYPPGSPRDAGLAPDVMVAPTVADIAAGHDLALTAAAAWITGAWWRDLRLFLIVEEILPVRARTPCSLSPAPCSLRGETNKPLFGLGK
eukprot:gene29895-39674_t